MLQSVKWFYAIVYAMLVGLFDCTICTSSPWSGEIGYVEGESSSPSPIYASRRRKVEYSIMHENHCMLPCPVLPCRSHL